jgi:hypothetical protein
MHGAESSSSFLLPPCPRCRFAHSHLCSLPAASVHRRAPPTAHHFHRLSWPEASLCCPRHPAPSLSSSGRLQPPTNGFPQPPPLPRWAHHRPVHSILLRPNQEYRKLAHDPLLLADPRFYSGSHPSAPRRPPLHRWLHRCRPPFSVSPLPPNRRQPVPLGLGFLRGNSLSGEPPPAGRISSEKLSVGKGKGLPCSHRCGPKGSCGPGWQLSAGPKFGDGSPLQQWLLSFSKWLIQINSIQIQIMFKLLKFIGTWSHSNKL